jgi:hypothetical protein
MFHFLSWEAQCVLRAANENIVIHVDDTSIGEKKSCVKGNHFHSLGFPNLSWLLLAPPTAAHKK